MFLPVLCVCVHVCARELSLMWVSHTYVQICVEARGWHQCLSQSLSICWSLLLLLIFFRDRVSRWTWSTLVHADWSPSEFKDHLTFASASQTLFTGTGVTDLCPCAQLFSGCWRSILRSHAWAAGILPAGPSCWPFCPFKLESNIAYCTCIRLTTVFILVSNLKFQERGLQKWLCVFSTCCPSVRAWVWIPGTCVKSWV